MEKNRTSLVVCLFLFLAISCMEKSKKEVASNKENFVKVKGTGFEIHGNPYHFLGSNFWYGINLGSRGEGGDRERLLRELDRMQNLGINNLRIVGLSEGPNTEPYRMVPAVQTAPGVFDEDLLKGLDFLLAEMAKRKMYSVICLNNFWPWSGGMAQYMIWTGSSDSIPYPPPHPGGSWDTYQQSTSKFYSDPKAMQLYWDAVKKIVTRTNSITNTAYSEDPYIMSWQLCNEPRGMKNQALFNTWIDSSAALIKSWDSNHLVTAGAEGYTSAPEYAGVDVIENHNGKNIDYVTTHVWVENWGWYDPKKNPETFDSAVYKMTSYLNKHIEDARTLSKPLVIEEFGIARDNGSFEPAASVKVRDDYYTKVFGTVFESASANSPVAGINFWAWGGEGRPRKPATMWKRGDVFIGDPPHELQGWYSVYDTDTTTIKVIKDYAAKFNEIK